MNMVATPKGICHANHNKVSPREKHGFSAKIPKVNTMAYHINTLYLVLETALL